MPVIMGIDLGTTQSCVAIPARPGRMVDEPVEIIPDAMGRKTTPSAVMADSHGNIVVGWVAKQSAGMDPQPIFFIKRYMGTDHTERLNGKDCRPEEISAETLKYLRRMTADNLRLPLEEVKKAVICIPAYFDLNHSQATKKAAELAGLEVMALLKEPIAAALAYGLEDTRENLKIFCYDLGGGTFDATVLAKTNGEPKVLAFGGDPFLGGYDFDKLLANYLIGKLKSHYRLDLDFSNYKDALLYQGFLAVAEKYKHRLSDDLEVRVREVDFKDQAGTAMSIDMSLTRQEYEDLIRGEEDRDLEELWEDYKSRGLEQALTKFMTKEGVLPEEINPRKLEEELEALERSIQHKPASIRKTRYLSIISLMKSGLFPQELNEVIMVGGSSHIPLVAEELTSLFGQRPTLHDPDAIVAKGAALKAKMIEGEDGEGPPGLKLHNIPRETFMEEINLEGRVEAGELQVSLDEMRVRLHRAPDHRQESSPDAQGNFKFQMVELLPDCENHLQVAVLAGGRTLVAYDFSIRHREDPPPPPPPPPPTDFLTKNIYIDTVDGRYTVFKAGEKIPNKKTIPAVTTDQSGKILIPILEGHQPRGTIKVDNLSTSLAIGTPVELSMEVTKDLDTIGVAIVPADNNKRGEVKIKIEILPLPPPEEMQDRFKDLQEEFDQALEVLKDPNVKMKQRTKGRNLIKSIDRELAGHPPNRPFIASMIEDLEYLINKINKTKFLQPSLDEFQDKVKEALDLDKNKKYARNIEALREEGEEAYRKRDQKEWRLVNQRVDDIIKELISEDIGPPPDPKLLAPRMKIYLLDKVRELSKLAQGLGVSQQYAVRLEDLKREVEAVDTEKEPVAAMNKMVALYQNNYQKLHFDITGQVDAEDLGYVKVQ